MAEARRARTGGIAGTWPPREAARAGGFAPSGFDAWSAFAAKLREWIAAEAGRRAAIALGARGLRHRHRVLFCRRSRAGRWVTAVAAVGLCAAAFLLRRQKLFPVAVMIAAMAAGFAAATWKTVRIAHGVLARPMYAVSLSGFVETRDIRERTDRFVLRVAHDGKPALADQTGARPAVGAQGHRARLSAASSN